MGATLVSRLGPVALLYIVLSCHGIVCGAADDSFLFATRNYSSYDSTMLGNGYLLSATPWNGSAPSPATVAGLYDHLQHNSYAYQPLIPAWNGFDYFNGTHWLNAQGPANAVLNGYAQTLDAGRGRLVTRYEWVDSNRSTAIETTIFPARQDGHLAVVRVALTPGYGVIAGPVTFSFPLGGAGGESSWEGAVLPGETPIGTVEPDTDGRGFVAVSETRDHAVKVAEAVRVLLPSDAHPEEMLFGVTRDEGKPALNIKFVVTAGRKYAFTKLVAVTTSLESSQFVQKARMLAANSERAGYESMVQKHEAAWRELLTTDIRIGGDPEAQRAVHAAMFYLLASLRPDAAASMPAVTLPSRAYLGRIWWDAETFVFPSLLVLYPETARAMAQYRCARLPEARQNAERHGLHGALFPTESAGTGQEEAPEWSSEIHPTGDVALAQWKYFLDTGDAKWLRECAFPVLRDVANFWASRAAYDNAADRYGILSVTGPNEAIVHVDNDSYTNAIARRVMETAQEAARTLGVEPNPEWARITAKMLIPFDAQKERHLEHSGDTEGRYAHALALLAYPLEVDASERVKRNDLDECLRNFGKPGYEVGMFGNFYSIIASELGDRDLAYRLFLSMLRSYAKPPFYAMSETPANNRFIFLTAEGAFLQQVIFGFTGLRLSNDALSRKYPPLLPLGWTSLELRRVNVKGKKYDVRVEQGGKLSMTPSS